MTYLPRLLVIAFVCSSSFFFCGSVTFAENLRYAGATTLQRDFMPDAAHRFGLANNTKFQIDGGNSGAGIKALAAGEIDLAGSGRYLTAQEKASGLVEHLIGWDPLVVVVQATNPIESVSLENLRRMLSGTARNWNQVGGRDLPILQVSVPRDSGIYAAVKQLLHEGEDISAQAIVSLVVGDAARNVALLPAAFTVTSASMVEADNVKVIKVDGLLPTRQNIASGAYPLVKPLLLVTKGKLKGSLALFINFAKSPEGQAIIAKKFYPLTN